MLARRLLPGLLFLFVCAGPAPGSESPGNLERAASAGPPDEKARVALMKAYGAQGNLLPAFSQAAWLLFLGEEETPGREAARYLRQSGGRGRIILSGLGRLPEPIQLSLLAVEAREKLLGIAARGTLAPQRESLRLYLSQAVERAAGPAPGKDPLGLAARVDCLLIADFAAEAIAWPGRGLEKPYLRRAASLAEQLTRELPASSRAWQLLALARERLARASGDWQQTRQALEACERALALRDSSSLRFTLDDLRGKLTGSLSRSEKARGADPTR